MLSVAHWSNAHSVPPHHRKDNKLIVINKRANCCVFHYLCPFFSATTQFCVQSSIMSHHMLRIRKKKKTCAVDDVSLRLSSCDQGRMMFSVLDELICDGREETARTRDWSKCGTHTNCKDAHAFKAIMS